PAHRQFALFFSHAPQRRGRGRPSGDHEDDQRAFVGISISNCVFRIVGFHRAVTRENHSGSRNPGTKIRNPKSVIQNSFFSRWRNAILGTLLVLTGLAAALFTILARRFGEPGLAGLGAIASLLVAFLITILVVPPLARSALLEVTRRGLPLEVTSGGVIFVIILVIVALAAWNTGNNLLFLVFSIMLSTLFVSWAAARLT